MSLRLEITCETAPGDVVAVSGSIPLLGEWQPDKAVRLAPMEGEANTWFVEFPTIPTGGSEFKLIIVKAGTGEIVWETLEENRKWPSTGTDYGGTFKMAFGNPRKTFEASPAYFEAHARATRKLEDRQGSALQHNVETKGENAYYFAHTRKFEVPPDAKVITGPGLITGGAPVLIEAGTVVGTEEDRVIWLKEYSWSDATGKVKVYVPVPEGLLPVEGADGMVEVNYSTTQVEVTINTRPRRKLKIEKLNAELSVDTCSTRVESAKNRIVLQLAKKRETTWYSLTKK